MFDCLATSPRTLRATPTRRTTATPTPTCTGTSTTTCTSRRRSMTTCTRRWGHTGHLTSCNVWPRATPTATTPTRPGGGATSGWRWTRPSGCWGPTWPRSTAGWRGWAGDGGQGVKTTSSLVISSFVFQHSTLFSSVIYLFLFLGWLGYKHFKEVPTVDSLNNTNCHWRMFERAGKDHYFTYFIHLKTSICSR